MVEHIHSQQMKAFCARALEKTEMVATAEHLAVCPECHQLFQRVFQEMNDHQPASISLSPELLFRQEHLDFDQLTSLADDNLDDEEKEIINIHLRVCERCREDVRSFLEYRRQIESGLNVRYAPEQPAERPQKLSSRWGWLTVRWKPLYAGAIAVAILIALLAIFFLQDGHKKDQGVMNTPSPDIGAPSPKPSITASVPERPSRHDEEPKQISEGGASKLPGAKPKSFPSAPQDVVATLRDNSRTIVIDRSGAVRGLDDVSAGLQRSIKETLLSQELRRPDNLDEIAGASGPSRGEVDKKSPFKLLYPVRTVIAEVRPVFKWQSIEGASSYEVQVADSRGREIANSKQLPATTTQWTPPVPLKRGVIYSWAVSATINGQIVVMPSPSAPEMKFKVLEAAKTRQLRSLKSRANSHLALGVFYALEGILEEAEREFQLLANDNPDSPIAAKLLRTVQSWR
jgi:hypothetical protein